MSANRKLQTEIDRTLKKVEEGVEVFDEVWDKVYSATQQNQKEKYEVDLKKEIKKLQRHRDQIKTWAASSDVGRRAATRAISVTLRAPEPRLSSAQVKDKRALATARKLIETKMEQFKVCEKETKTKTYSKEGLAREARVDPHEAARRSTRAWLRDAADRLGAQVDAAEADVERLSAGRGAKKHRAEVEALDAALVEHEHKARVRRAAHPSARAPRRRPLAVAVADRHEPAARRVREARRVHERGDRGAKGGGGEGRDDQADGAAPHRRNGFHRSIVGYFARV